MHNVMHKACTLQYVMIYRRVAGAQIHHVNDCVHAVVNIAKSNEFKHANMCTTRYVHYTICALHDMCTTQYVHYTICALHNMCTTRYVHYTIGALHDISRNKLRFTHTRSLPLLDHALALKKKCADALRASC